MEKPAVVFSEEGFKMFLEFMRNTSGGLVIPGKGPIFDHNYEVVETPLKEQDDVLDGQMSIDDAEFFDAYDEFKGIKKPAPDPDKPKKRVRRPKPDGFVTPRKAFEESRKEYEIFKEFLIYNGSTKLDAIWQYMNEKGQWDFPQKQASSRVKTLNKHFGGIERVGVGIYRMRG